MKNDREQRAVLSRDQWLEMALESLNEGGKNKFSLDALLKAMPVSKGSFYWHFKNRADFLIALVEHWDQHETQNVISRLESLPDDLPATDVLWELMCMVYETRSARYDLIIRSLTLEFPEIRDAVKAVDQKRLKAVGDVFAGMGFTGDELEMRTLVFVATTSLDRQIFFDLSVEAYERQLKLRHAFFTANAQSSA